MSRVICAGHVNWDVTLRVDALPDPDGEATVESRVGAGGGSAANVASGLVGLGVPSSLLGSVGDDEHGHAAVAELASKGVDCRYVERVDHGPTTVKYVVVDAAGEVFVLGSPGVNEAFEASNLPAESLAAADHLHLTSQAPATAAALARRATEVGTTVSFDPGRRIGDRGYTDALRQVDFVFLNDREAATALGEASANDSNAATNGSAVAKVLEQTTLVLKHGPNGAEVRDDGEQHVHPGYPIDAVDTTGAGDAFASGFIAARIEGTSYERALTIANACGALTAAEPGARTQLSWQRLDDLIDG
ncbi:carbohydrate kinase family protein [Haloferax mediterranei ATCC 33500]|uniref:Carbohydrate kinase family protein n=1 Tax=Haloferax mediterranei (strain ATCC 33500 / DSM 1411 / JCM 8866 / NBRC 14739 / NCIMB 2177 / R-4) TaxID=523841 RepID=I3R7U4_HALMT|nr:PfkB family carbohydrate kinase [Haloferax mediterranei]AFK20304.2 sugar kinase, ribokinase [Haloferax mediterranei ATCC 33500]AHZ23673.1 sugar kinase [Haloferax mediterranei ATCC 33500]ELZ99160.1 sugar kinase [Haloferax mediterranei ATCC 33500]MDX5986941.1 PfkB family carbohydrate kinase [Haloferax mediterranei ATCC 33500]QCQ76260.1 carbohydrate kinase family protein [Haloferax mediterranei ATCC 33500]